MNLNLVISFCDSDIRAICQDADVARVKLGSPLATVLHSRLSDMAAAETVKELPAGDPSELANEHSCYKVDLVEGYRLVFCSNHPKTPIVDDKINWSEVRRVRILKIEKVP